MGFLHFDYMSEVLGYHTNLYVLLPACTHEGKAPRATLYLLHGGSGNGLDWVRYTAIERLADSFELAVVMPEVDGSCFYSDMKYGYKYFTYLTTEVVTVAESLFPVNREPEKRLVAGLSMGGYGAFKWAFLKPEMFAAAANLSGFSLIMDIFSEGGFAKENASGPNGVIELCWGSLQELKGSDSDSKEWIDRASTNRTKLPKLFTGIGTEDFSYAEGKKFLDYAEKNGIEIHSEEMAGKHEWKVWEEMLERFLTFAL